MFFDLGRDGRVHGNRHRLVIWGRRDVDMIVEVFLREGAAAKFTVKVISGVADVSAGLGAAAEGYSGRRRGYCRIVAAGRWIRGNPS